MTSGPISTDTAPSNTMEEYRQQCIRTRALIESITFCMCGFYCTLKEYFCAAPRSSKEFLQIKCVEKLRYERGDLYKRPVDWEEAFKYWFEEGHVTAFALHFKEGIDLETLYSLIMNEPRKESQQVNSRTFKGLGAQLAKGFPLHLMKPSEIELRSWRKRRQRLVDSIAGCSHGHYCTLKEILCSGPEIARQILQIKCVEKFKYDRGGKFDRFVSWEEAMEMWGAEKYTERFAAFYHEDAHFEDLYRRIMGPEPLPGT